MKGIMMTFGHTTVINIKSQGFVYLHRREMPGWDPVGEAKNISEPPGWRFFGMDRDYGLISSKRPKTPPW